MSAALDILGWAALIGGAFFCLVGAIGLNRMPDIFTRMHATSVSDTLGVGLLTLGMLTQTDDWAVAARLLIILIVLYVTGAVASHALARAALHDGNKPLLSGPEGELQEVDCEQIFPELGARLAKPLLSEMAEGAATEAQTRGVPEEDEDLPDNPGEAPR
ncbi:MAG: monovalent cation/H(+) antiporter subunit G [Pseudomonadota bacterium]